MIVRGLPVWTVLLSCETKDANGDLAYELRTVDVAAKDRVQAGLVVKRKFGPLWEPEHIRMTL